MSLATLTPREEETAARKRLRALRRAQDAKRRADTKRRRQREREVAARRRWLVREGELFHRYRGLADSGAAPERVAAAYHAWTAHWSQGAPGA